MQARGLGVGAVVVGSPRGSAPGATLRSLRAGLRLLSGAPVEPAAFRVGPDPAALLLGLAIAVAIACDYALTDPPRVFLLNGLARQSLGIVLIAAFAWLVGRSAGRPERTAPVAIAVLSAVVSLWILYAAIQLGFDAALRPSPRWLLWLVWGGGAVWGLAVSFRAARHVGGLGALQAALLALLLAGASDGIDFAAPSAGYWYTDFPESSDTPAEPAIDAEALLYAQPDRLEDVRRSLEPQRPGVVDLYAVVFGADATQDVFRKEVEYVQELFDRRFDTAGRSVLLVNHEETADAHPLATATNLASVLELVGATLDPEEDLLFLYLTGHGSSDHELQAKFPPLPLNAIDPPRLAGMLASSGIPGRVVVVSACYSGGFVDALADPHTLVASAAASDRRSFGCSNDAELTYFGEALFAGALEETRSFETALERAAERIAEREQAEGKQPSRPQLAGGDALRPRLARLEQRTTHLAAASDASGGVPRNRAAASRP